MAHTLSLSRNEVERPGMSAAICVASVESVCVHLVAREHVIQSTPKTTHQSRSKVQPPLMDVSFCL